MPHRFYLIPVGSHPCTYRMAVQDIFPVSALVILTLLIAGLIHRISKIGQREPLLPPGPATTPILGNISVLPKKDGYIKFNEWAKQYGEIFSLKVGPKTMVVLSSVEAIHQVMDKNGLITANKPSFAHRNRIFGDDGVISSVEYGPRYRIWRRAANEVMSLSACQRHAPIQSGEVSQLMVNLLDRPEDFLQEIKRSVLSTIFSVFFGVRSPSISSPEPQRFLGMVDAMFNLGAPGAYPPIHLIPLLYYIPDKFANNWKRRSDDLKRDYDDFWNELSTRAENKLEAGISTGCFIETLTIRASEWDLTRKTIRNMAGSFVLAGVHTTISTIQWVVMLTTIYFEKQEKLREEVDRVVGLDQLPTLEDIPKLPYLHAFIREVHRFRTIVPLSVAHVASEDQFYKGYLIPKGSSIIPNIWGVLHDPSIFDHPNEFIPERFVNPTAEQSRAWDKIETLPFGVGRRICPGVHLANTTVELMTACLIWGFEFKSPEVGGPHVDDFNVGFTNNPSPFKCDIKPRSQVKAAMIRHNFASCQPFLDLLEKDV